MAEGGADVPENPWVDDNLDAHDSDEETEVSRGDTTQPFQPGGSSTPYYGGEGIEMQTHLHEESGLPDIPEMPVDENAPLLGPTSQQSKTLSERLFGVREKKPDTLRGVRRFIIDKYPNADFSQLEGGGWKIGFGSRARKQGTLSCVAQEVANKKYFSKGAFVDASRYFRKK